MKQIIATILISILTLPGFAIAENMVLHFEPIDTVRHLEMDFPFSATVRLEDGAITGDTSIITVELTATRDVEESRIFLASARPDEYAHVPGDSIVWTGIKKDAEFAFEVPIVFDLGGNYEISVSQISRIGKAHTLYPMVAAFGPDGNLVYFGESPSPVTGCVGNFITTNTDTLRMVKLNRFEELRKIKGSEFDLEMSIYPTPAVGEWSTVDFVIRPNRRFMRDIQFGWEYFPTLKLQGYPDSWDARPEPGDVFAGSFQFKPRYFGFSFVRFTVFAKDVRSSSGKSHTDVTFYMAFDSTETLRYLGTENICDCGIPEDDPLYSYFKPILHFKGFMMRLKRYRSKPDFEAIALEESLKDDTNRVDQSQIDSVLNEMRRK